MTWLIPIFIGFVVWAYWGEWGWGELPDRSISPPQAEGE